MHIVQVMLPGEIREIQAESGMRISDALQAAGIALHQPCGGGGKCGKCRVRAVGECSPAPDADGFCLACQTHICGPMTIWPQEEKLLQSMEGMGSLPEFELNPLPGEYGLAVDIGTTTIAARLVSLRDGSLMESVCAENPQRRLGHDVIRRIQASLEGRGDVLQMLAGDAIGRMCAELCRRSGISENEISARVYTGNTAMLYLATGRNPSSMARAPFEADCLFDSTDGNIYFPPCFGAYVGADIACALLASDAAKRHRTAMLIDIGTNGEICLMHNGRITCCATAAGPAFEGAGISCGVSSVQGAIESVRVEDGRICISTIGDVPPAGICGSGLIDAAAALLEIGVLDEGGYLEEAPFALAEGVALTQKDIRMIQLAKGSICAGIESLLAGESISPEEVEAVYIAGGFGRHINIASAMRIGLIPRFRPDRVHAIGNAALSGAVMLLLSQNARDEIRSLVKCGECINLARLPRFQSLYAEAMLFPEE